MGLFNKNKKKNAPTEVPVTEVPVSKKKKKDTMASVLRESVIERSLEELRANKDCIVDRNGELVYTTMHLRVADIGGLSKSTNKDEAKGSIVETINNGRIKALITAEMLEAEEIIIIPDAMTLDAMDEYSLLTEAPYRFAFITDNGEIDVTDYSVRFDDVKATIEAGNSIDDLLVDCGVDFVLDKQPDGEQEYDDIYTMDNDDDAEEYDEEPDELPDDDDGLPFDGDDEGYNDMPDDEPDMPEDDDIDNYDEPEDVPDDDDEPDENDEYAQNSEVPDGAEDEEDEVPEEVTEEKLEETVIRKFYSDDLGLEVSTAPFDAQFSYIKTYVPFDENRGEGWLNQYLNELSKKANIELQRVHQSNHNKLRDAYLRLMSLHCEEIQKKLDIMNPETPSSQMMMKIDVAKKEAQAKLNESVNAKREELENEWADKLKKVADDAAAEATQQYIVRFGRQHEADIQKLRSVAEQKCEEDYQESVRDLNDFRRSQASQQLDYGITEVLKSISEMAEKCLEDEQAVYQKFANEISEFIERNRAEDIANREVAQKELETSNKVANLMAEYKENLEAKTAEFEAQRQALEADMFKREQAAKALVEDKDIECKAKLDAMQQTLVAKQDEIDKLLDKYSALDEAKNKEYASRINELNNQCKSWQDKCDHIEAAGKRNNTITASLIIVAVVAALAIGILSGMFININKSVDNYRQSQSQVQTYTEPSTQAVLEQTTEPSTLTQQQITNE